MWQRFTERARRAIYFAQEEAGRFNDNYVSTEHLLLGLTREKDNVAIKILTCLGASETDIKTAVEALIAHGNGRIDQDMQLTPRAKRVIALSYDEARDLNSNYIGTGHLLLGLISEGEGLAHQVLESFNITLEAVREKVSDLMDDNPEAAPKSAP